MGVKTPTDVERWEAVLRRIERLLDAAERHPLIRSLIERAKQNGR